MQDLARDSSSVALVGLLFLLVMSVLMWRLPRKYAAIPLLIATCYMPLGQQFVIAGLHFTFIRVLLLVGCCRVFSKRETEGLRLTKVDKLFIWWALVTLVVGTLTKPSFDRLVNRSGEVYNAVGSYFLIRCWVRNMEDVIGLVRVMALMIVPMAVSMIVEKYTSRNVFFVFGGVPEVTVMREGKLRCQAAFRHPILAGTYAATLFPLFVGLWSQQGGNKRRATIGAVSAVIATIAASSSGALLALLSAFIGWALWFVRNQMRWVRRGCALALIGLCLVMNAPVWFLIARISAITGGTGWHRSYLMDQAIKHFDEWWLVGSAYTAHWAPGGQVLPIDPDNMDITNEYIGQGLAGGIWKLALLLALVVQSFKTIGRWTKGAAAHPPPHILMVWAMGVCLFGHCVSFLSVTYFDQIFVMWYWLLAIVSMLACEHQRLGELIPATQTRQNAFEEAPAAARPEDVAAGTGLPAGAP